MISVSILQVVRPLVLAALTGAMAYGSTVYNSVLTIGNGSVDLSLTTDGATGVLTASDILAWSLDISDQFGGPNQFSSQDCSFCGISIGGSDVTATNTALFFDFSGSDDGFLEIVKPSFSPAAGSAFLEASVANGLEESVGGFLIPDPANQVAESGNVLIANAAPETLLPEPASLAMLLLGLLVLITIGSKDVNPAVTKRSTGSQSIS